MARDIPLPDLSASESAHQSNTIDGTSKAFLTLQHRNRKAALCITPIVFEPRVARNSDRPTFLPLATFRKLAYVDIPTLSVNLHVSTAGHHEVFVPVWRPICTTGGPYNDQIISTGHVHQHDGVCLSAFPSDNFEREAWISENHFSFLAVAGPILLHLIPCGCTSERREIDSNEVRESGSE